MDGDRFAPVFEYFRTYLLAGDSTAKIISPGVLNWEWTCYQLCGYQQGKVWVEEFVDAYESRFGENPPVDVWAIHTYPIDWTNTPNNDPDTAKQPTYKGSKTKHSGVVIDQLEGMREYLNGNGYADTPIWIGEIAIHVGFDGWQPVGDGFGPVGDYHWDNMRDYISEVLDWLETNAASNKIEKWFFFKTWKDIQNPPSFDPYMGYVFFNESGQGTSRNCLGDLYRARSLGEDRVKCDANGNTVLE